MHLKQGVILSIHIGVAFGLAYLAYNIINRKQLPVEVGYLLAVLSIAVIIAHLYFYSQSKNKK